MASIRRRNGKYQVQIRVGSYSRSQSFHKLNDAKSWARKEEELAEQRKANAAARKEATAKLNKTVGGSSKFKNSFTKAPAMSDPFADKKFKNSFKMPKIDLMNVKLWK